MILFFNVHLSPHRLNNYNRNPWFLADDRVDVFKYAISSYQPMSTILFKQLFCIGIDQEYAHRKEELELYIREIFPNCQIYWHRINSLNEWRYLSDQFDDNDVIWHSGNDDHVFIDYSLDIINDAAEILKNDTDPLASLYYSHWPEQCRLSQQMQACLTENKNFVKFKWHSFDSIQMFKGSRLKAYWNDNKLNSLCHLYRTDMLSHYRSPLLSTFYTPTRELVRHFDGYSHVSPHLLNIAPPLIIPPGFFENNIKIRIGFKDHLDGWVTLDSTSNLYSFDHNGVDYRWLNSDIPIFWRDKISEVMYAQDYNEEQQAFHRDAAYIACTRQPMNCYDGHFDHKNEPPVHWFSKHLKHEKNKSFNTN